MDKRFVLFIAISVGILVGYNYLFQPAKKPIHSSAPTQIITPEQETSEKNQRSSENIIKNVRKAPKNAQNVEISNDKISMNVNSYGANLTKAVIRNFGNNVKESFNLVDDQKQYFKTQSVINDKQVDLNFENWEIISSNKNSVVFKAEPIQNVLFYKKYTLENNYYGTISLEIQNNSDNQISLQQTGISWGPTRALNNQQYNQKQAVVLNVRKVDRFKSKKKAAISTLPITSGWVGIRDQYFCAIFYGSDVKQAVVQQLSDQSLEIVAGFPDKNVSAHEKIQYTSKFFVGPQNYDLLKQGKANLEKVIDFGIFRFLAIPMLYLLKWFYNLTNNYGFAIILLTIVIRIILWWPTQKSYSSMKKMQSAMNKMQPRLKTLKELYHNNPQKLNEETMKLYQEYKINPMGGCLPMLLQMPIFFALYSTLSAAVELKGANFVWIWKDLSKSDPWYILPIAMGVTMFIQQKMSTPPSATPEAAAQQKMMLYLMPVMLTFFAFMWPSGLLLYWVISNILSIGQQMVINRQKD